MKKLNQSDKKLVNNFMRVKIKKKQGNILKKQTNKQTNKARIISKETMRIITDNHLMKKKKKDKKENIYEMDTKM